jgi:hypothetical protein
MPGHGQYHMIGKKRFFREQEYWETLEYPQGFHDYYLYASFDVPNYDPTDNSTVSGSPNGIEQGSIYFRGQSYVNSNKVNWGFPTFTQHGIKGNLGSPISRKYGIISHFKGISTSGSPEFPVTWQVMWGVNYSGNDFPRYDCMGYDGGIDGSGIGAPGQNPNDYWMIPVPDGGNRALSAIPLDITTVTDIVTMHGGYQTPITGGVMGGDPATSVDDTTATYGSRSWIKDNGVWKLLYIDALEASSIIPTFTTWNSSSSITSNTITYIDRVSTTKESYAPRGLQLLNPTGYVDNLNDAESRLLANGFTINGTPIFWASGITAEVDPDEQYYISKDFGWSDGFIRITTNRSTYVGTSIILRATNTSLVSPTFIGVRHFWSGGIYDDLEIYQMVNGSYAQLAHKTGLSRSASDLWVSFSGPVIAAGWSSGFVMRVNITLNQSVTRHGFGADTPNSRPTCYSFEAQPEQCEFYDSVLNRLP